MKNDRFHMPPDKYREYEEKSLQKALSENRITKKDAALIREFASEIAALNNISAGRRYKIIYSLIGCRQFLPEYATLTTPDLFEGMQRIREGHKSDGTQYKANTKADFSRFTKRFAIWLAQNGYADLNLQKIQKIKTVPGNSKTKTEENILTEEETKRLIDAARTVKYKALLGLLYEGGLRVGEVANLRWSDITFNSWGARLRVSFKTKFIRSVPIIAYRGLLSEWRSSYPGDPVGQNFVFLSSRGEPMQYRGLAKAISIFAKDAGITKRVTPHVFRHSRITHALQGGMQETLAKKVFWGNEATFMISTYSHLVDDDADRAFAKLAGVELPDQEKGPGAMSPIQCPRCLHINEPSAPACRRCGLLLTETAQADYERTVQAIEQILSYPEGMSILFELQAKKNKA